MKDKFFLNGNIILYAFGKDDRKNSYASPCLKAMNTYAG